MVWTTLPGWIYRNEEFFALEREAIFMRSWQLAGHQSEIPAPGDYLRFDLLGESAILKNVQTWKCADPEDRAYVLAHLKELVVKEVHGSGGYGMLVGPKSTKEQIAAYAERIKADPADFIAQPTLALSTCPTFADEGLAPRHVDLRPYCLVGREVHLCPGGLTRVALTEGSLVVNSSQGGGVKDTWVLAD